MKPFFQFQAHVTEITVFTIVLKQFFSIARGACAHDRLGEQLGGQESLVLMHGNDSRIFHQIDDLPGDLFGLRIDPGIFMLFTDPQREVGDDIVKFSVQILKTEQPGGAVEQDLSRSRTC